MSYCGRECQKKDYIQHKIECSYLSRVLEADKLTASDILEEIRLLLRTHGKSSQLKKKKGSLQCHCIGATDDHDYTKIISCGVDHFEDMALAPADLVQVHPDVVQHCSSYMSSQQVHTYSRTFQANNFGILNDMQDTIGTGVYPHAAILNHSCQPNCLLRYIGTTMEIVSLVNTIDVGDELTHSYVELVQDTETRQAHLQQLHGFSCSCARCMGRVFVDLPATVSREDGWSGLYDWMLQHQLSLRDRPVSKQDVELQSIPIDKALDSFGGQNSPETVEEARQLMLEAHRFLQEDDNDAERSKLLHAVSLLTPQQPLSLDLYQARGAYLSCLIAQGNFAEAATQCRAIVAFLATVLPSNHPLLGLQLFTLGDLTGISIYHRWARSVLQISLGQENMLVKRLDEVLQ
jgi:hypothetical protein